MAFSPPPVAPQRGDRTTFSSRVDAFLLWLTALIPQLNTFLSSITTLAAGGANAFSYGFDNSTTNGDPGAGRVRFGSSPQNTANVIMVSATAGNGGSIGPFLTALQAGTSSVKSALRFQKVGDVTSYLLFDITAVAAATGYYNLTVTPRASTAASPFAANDTLVLFFDPKGDKGDSGGTPTQAEIIAAVGTLPISSGGTGATSAANALNNLGGAPKASPTFTGQMVVPEGTSAIPGVAFANDGALDTGFYHYGDGQFGITCNTNVTWQFGANQSATYAKLFSDTTGQGANYTALQLKNSNGLNVSLEGSGPNPFKTLRLVAGSLTYMNSAYSQAIWTLTDAGEMSVPGNFTAAVVTETSDERKKTNWRPLTDEQLDALAGMDLVGVFDWIDGSGTAVGASAQQIQRIVPWAVHEDAEGGLTVAYGGLAFAMAHGALRRSRRAVA